MKKILISGGLILIMATFAQAQNQIDALRFSQFYYGGTARSMAMGGAFGALGADFSSLSTNPAGIGLYKTSEFSITPSLFVGNTKSDYAGNFAEDIKYNFNVSNLGLVFTVIPKKETSDWKGIQVGFGVNRLANFNNATMTEGPNRENSILNDYLLHAAGLPPDKLNPFDTELAFNTYLIDTIGSATDYFSAVPRGGALQTNSIETKGSANEMVLTLGGNFNERLYIGATLGFPYLRFNKSSTYRELDEADTIADFKQLYIYDDEQTDGSGINFKLGLIYRITDWVRIGAAIHTPTFYSLKYKFSRKMNSQFDNGMQYSDETNPGRFNYELTTPLRATGNIAFIINKYALLSFDYEFVDYSDARMRSSQYKFFDENEMIRKIYQSTSNVRAGVEINLSPVFVRGGWQLNTSPYKNNLNDGSRMAFSGGLGLRQKAYFFDLAYVFAKKTEDYYLYPSNLTAVENTFSDHNILLSFGFKF
jgi:long-subunit fatty acid transport protein